MYDDANLQYSTVCSPYARPSWPIQLVVNTVWHGESGLGVRNRQIPHPDQDIQDSKMKEHMKADKSSQFKLDLGFQVFGKQNIYTGSVFEVQKCRILHPDGKAKKNQPKRTMRKQIQLTRWAKIRKKTMIQQYVIRISNLIKLHFSKTFWVCFWKSWETFGNQLETMWQCWEHFGQFWNMCGTVWDVFQAMWNIVFWTLEYHLNTYVFF